MATDDHHHPTGHTPKAVSPHQWRHNNHYEPSSVPRGIASKEDVTPKGPTDALPKVDRVFTQGPHLQQVEWLLMVPPMWRTTPEGTVTKSFHAEQPQLAARREQPALR
jgi:hypothetical protein